MKLFITALLLISSQALACQLGKPEIGINPGYQYSYPGGAGFVQILLHNTDSPDCADSVLNMTAQATQNMKAGFIDAAVPLKPGQRGQTYLFYQVAPNAVSGQNLVFVYAKDDSHASFSSAVVDVKN